MSKFEKGFSLVELMVVIAIIAILAAVAVPMYANHVIKAKIGSEIVKLGAIKAMAGEYTSFNNGNVDYTSINLGDLPDDVTIGDNGVLLLNTSNIVENSSISLVPTVTSGSMLWNCSTQGLTSSQIPSTCQLADSASNSSELNVIDSSEYLSNNFDTNLLENNNSYNGAYSISCAWGSASCYSYGDDQSVYDDEDEFESTIYPGATTGETADDDLSNAQHIKANPDTGITYTNDSQNISETFTSLDDIDNSNLSEEQKQSVYTTIDVMKSTDRFCGSNSSFFAC